MFKNNFSVNENEKQINEYVRFPTFVDEELNEEIKQEFTFEMLKLELEKIIHFFNTIIEKMDFIFDKNKYKDTEELKQSLEINKLNYISLRLTFTFYNRQFNLFYHLIKYNKTNNNDDRQKILSFYNTNENEFKTNFLNTYSQYTSENNNEYTIKLINELFITEKEICNKIKELGENYIPGYCSLCIGIKQTNKILIQIFEYLDILILNKDKNFSQYTEKDLLPLYSNLNKIETCGPLLSYLYFRDQKDIFNISENSIEWINLKKKLHRIMLLSKEQMKIKIKQLTEMVNVGYAALSKASENKDNSELMFKAKSGMLLAYYFFNTEKANHQSMRFLIKPDLTVTQKIWNILETKEISTAMKVIIPYIKYCKKFYFKRTKNPIIIGEINNLTNFINNENNLENKFIISIFT